MSLRRFPPTNRNDEVDLENDTKPTSTYTSNVTTAPSHTLSGCDSVRQRNESEPSLTDTLEVAEKSKVVAPNYIYYRIYAEDGGIPLKTPVAPGDPFLGHIKARSVPPPRTVKAVKCSIAEVENIKRTNTTIFLTPSSQSPMDDAENVTISNGTGPGSTPQEPLALVAKMSSSERSALESKRSGGLASAAEPDTTIQYLYYLLYGVNYEMTSKVAFDPEEPSLGRIRADTVAPPHGSTSIQRCISRVERNPALAWYADLFADTSCNTPLEEGHITILRTDGPGLSTNEPMAIVLRPPIPDGKYAIKNRAEDVYWNAGDSNTITKVYFHITTMEFVKNDRFMQWDITHDNNGDISITSPYAPSSWVGADMTGSTVPVPWRLIPADSQSYYLTTDVNDFSQNPRVPVAQGDKSLFALGSMVALKEGDQRQMWQFIRI